jgi:thiol-disulfide isomerase/thioredoxin
MASMIALGPLANRPPHIALDDFLSDITVPLLRGHIVTKFKILCATLYTLLALGANPLAAENLDTEALKEMRQGDLRLIAIHSEPRPVVMTPFLDAEENTIDLSKYAGKIILLNFWATWCAPCRAEMPSLDALNQDLGGDTFEVVTVAVGRNPIPMIEKFFDENSIENLPILRDPKMKFSGASGVRGLPVTLILNAKGEEIARIQREADWNSPEAKALINAIIQQSS